MIFLLKGLIIMDNNMEIQREETIEIVGTQYDGRAANHQGLMPYQKLVMKHQKDNRHDPNAVIILTDDGKELGYLPKGYASLYAPAIDNDRYSFAVEIIKTEYDYKRPILIVKIISELNNCSEEEVEKNILQFVNNIVDECAKRKTEYLKFIYSETVDTDELLTSLNKVRLIQKLYSLSGDIITDIITNNNIKQTTTDRFPDTTEELLNIIDVLLTNINYITKELQKTWNEYIDIDIDDDKTLNDIRKRRKRFCSYGDLFHSYHEAVEKHISININAVSDTETETEIVSDNSEPVTENKVTDKSSNLTEKAFFDWLVSDGDVSKTTANVYISNIHGIEKLYQNIYGVRKNLLGAVSADDAKVMIETLVQRNEYNNIYNASLGKFVQFAGISVDKLKIQPVKKNYQPPVKSGNPIIKTVDFENPNNCTYYKPCSFILNKFKYFVKNWKELYTKFLQLLYKDNTYTEIMKSMIGKSLYGRRSDFEKRPYHLRKSIRIAANFYAEGNLSTIDIIKHIKYIMELCSIDNDNMIIEYYTYENSCKDTEVENVNSTSEDYENYSMPEQEEKLTQVSFTGETTKPFVLKDALIEILSSNAPEIKNYKKYKNGISLTSLREILKRHYQQRVEIFEILRILINDKAFQSVGKGYYVLKPISATSDFQEPVTHDKETDETLLQENTDKSPDFPVSSSTEEQADDETTKIITKDTTSHETASDTRNIVLKLNRNTVRTYDYSDALNKICEFAINFKPFKMARIAGQGICIKSSNVFYRSAVPVDNYNKLSNGLQIIAIYTLTDLQTITEKVKKYCQIDDDMITIISE